MRSARILVVEDENDIRESFCAILESDGCSTQGAGTIREARHACETFKPELVLLDLGLPDGSGLDLLGELREEQPGLTIVVITAETRIETAVQAMKLGATDYLEKPIGLDRLRTTVRLCLEQLELRDENRTLREQALARYEILGHSGAIEELLAKVERVADADIPVLVTGENGTGKELIARQLHLRSPRYKHPFVATNCAAVPETLIEAEFFGHVKGAFTGADRDRDGRFVEAGMGTLFLDEIGEMPAQLQARLLRVLQERSVTPLGSSEQRPVHCRIVAATNKDLEAEIEAGTFREDLYYRIRGVELTVPPLRERGDDILLLAQHFLDAALSEGQRSLELGESARRWLYEQDWPGNVRQLGSLMRSAALLLDEGAIEADELKGLARPPKSGVSSGAEAWFPIDNIREFRDAVEKEYLRRKLEEEGWNVSATARRIGIRRTNLHERLKHHGLK